MSDVSQQQAARDLEGDYKVSTVVNVERQAPDGEWHAVSIGVIAGADGGIQAAVDALTAKLKDLVTGSEGTIEHALKGGEFASGDPA